MNSEVLPKWPAVVLRVAAVYNISWGTWVVLFPHHLFDWNGIGRPNYPGIWQCVGMMVGVYGIAYWFAAKDFVRHWPIVLVGFLGKVLGLLGFLQSALVGILPWSWGWTSLFNDVIWLPHFAVILYLVIRIRSDPNDPLALDSNLLNVSRAEPRSIEQLSRETMVSNGDNLRVLSQGKKLLLVFVRHAGCTFCRETLIELKNNLPNLQERSITPVVVHLGTAEDGQKMLDRAGLKGILHISNPNADLYRAYDLRRGQLSQLLGPRVWWRGVQSAILRGNGTGALVGDGFQLGGAFLVENGKITKSFPAKDASSKVPFECILELPFPQSTN